MPLQLEIALSAKIRKTGDASTDTKGGKCPSGGYFEIDLCVVY